MRFGVQVLLLLLTLVDTVVAGPSSSTSTPWGVNVAAVRGGASSSSSGYASQLDQVKDKVLKKAETAVSYLFVDKRKYGYGECDEDFFDLAGTNCSWGM